MASVAILSKRIQRTPPSPGRPHATQTVAQALIRPETWIVRQIQLPKMQRFRCLDGFCTKMVSIFILIYILYDRLTKTVWVGFAWVRTHGPVVYVFAVFAHLGTPAMLVFSCNKFEPWPCNSFSNLRCILPGSSNSSSLKCCCCSCRCNCCCCCCCCCCCPFCCCCCWCRRSCCNCCCSPFCFPATHPNSNGFQSPGRGRKCMFKRSSSNGLLLFVHVAKPKTTLHGVFVNICLFLGVVMLGLPVPWDRCA